MATTLDSLVLNFQVQNAQLNAGLRQAESRIDSFTGSVKKNFAIISAAYASMFAIKGLVDVITKFEKLEASLRTVTGSAKLASQSFAGLQQFASTTPFQLEEVVAAFIKLKALGLTPSEEALTSFGNTAIAMGKSLNQFIEAVADAATGEFERLKEFGIKARSQGEQVTFTFQGMATTVGKNAAEIEGYLRSIGNVQFAGAMAEQAGTLNVSLSNLQDAFNQLVKEIGDAGLTDILILLADTLKNTIKITEIIIKQFRFMGYSVLELGANINSTVLGLLGFDEAANKAAESARYYVEQIAALNESGLLPEDVSAEGDGAKSEQMQKDLEKFQESLMTETELEMKNYEERLQMLRDFYDNKLITSQEANDLQAEEMQRHEDALTDIIRRGNDERLKFDIKSNKDKAKDIFGTLSNITDGVAQHNRGLFEINKVAGISNAIINTYEGISGVLAKYPGPVGWALAAVQAAAGFAQVSAIRSTSFGGGGSGSAPSIAGSTAAAPVSDVGSGGGQSSNLDVRLSGISPEQMFSGEQVKGLIGKINEAIEDGAIIRSVRTV